mgnify:CR=1 FL=1|tara:strand:+ start:809 stop:1087 length:279 start_codon:yes stop_codon:yes gene_type:complete
MYNKETYNKLVDLIMSGDIDLVFELSKSINLTVLKKLVYYLDTSFYLIDYLYSDDRWLGTYLLRREHYAKLKKIYNVRINKIKRSKYSTKRK